MANGILQGYDFPENVAAPLGIDRVSGEVVNFNTSTLPYHGTICGATGMGKSRTIQGMVEWCSERGIPTLLTDGKGDMSGLCLEGELNDSQQKRVRKMGQDWWAPTFLPTEFLSLGGNGVGVPVRFTVGTFGSNSLSKLLKLTPAQAKAFENAYREIHNDSRKPVETLEDLCAVLRGLRDDPDKSLTEAMCARVIDAIETFSFKNPGLFGGPEFDIFDLLRKDDEDYGYVSIVDASNLLETPEVMTTSILWVLDQLVKHMPEIGGVETKLVVFIDEAHTLFEDAPKEFIRIFVSTIKRLRSKGVGIILCSQQMSDIPEPILDQCGLRIQHTIRVNSPKARRLLKQTVDTFPESAVYNIEKEMVSMPIGTALVVILDENGMSTEPSVCQMFTPRTNINDLLEPEQIAEQVQESDLGRKYARMQFEREEADRARKRAPQPLMRPRIAPEDADLWSALQNAHSGSGDVAADLGMDDADMEAASEYLAEQEEKNRVSLWG